MDLGPKREGLLMLDCPGLQQLQQRRHEKKVIVSAAHMINMWVLIRIFLKLILLVKESR